MRRRCDLSYFFPFLFLFREEISRATNVSRIGMSNDVNNWLVIEIRFPRTNRTICPLNPATLGGTVGVGGRNKGRQLSVARFAACESADTYCAIRESFRRLKVHRRFPLCKAMHPRDQSISRHFAIRRSTVSQSRPTGLRVVTGNIHTG